MNNFSRLLLSLFYIGDIKIAPGTMGSIFTMTVWYFIPNLLVLQFSIIISVLILALFLCYNFDKSNDEKDPKYIVIDESVGMMISLLMIPKTLSLYLLCLILFRFFDILKPSIINRSENISNGIGIVADDVLSGALTFIVVFGYINL